jgi:phage baseplate assembly protein W
MSGATLFGKGISFPPRLGGNGGIVWSEGEDNIRDSIRVILLTELGERLRRPGFGAGLARFLFEPNTVATRFSVQGRIQTALQQWEPRISVESVAVEEDPDDAQAAIATITYRLVATQTLERVSLNVQLGASPGAGSASLGAIF